MEFEVPTRRVGSPRRWPAAIPLGVAAVVLAAAVLGAREPPEPVVTGRASPSPTAAPRVIVPPAPTPVPSLARVPVLDCGDMVAWDCPRAVTAARLALHPGHAEIREAVASASLICGNAFDCPRWFLADARFVGSLSISFADGHVAWINVVEPPPDGVREGSPREFVARVVRWFEATG